MTEGADAAIWSLWAKSDAGGRPHSVPGHLLDSGAVAELIWDHRLAPATRAALDDHSNGHGRDVLVLVAAWHDLGKATPAFQAQVPTLAARLAPDAWPMPRTTRVPLKHGRSGAIIARRVLEAASATGIEWLLTVIDGHHGSFLWDDPRDYLSKWQDGGPSGRRRWTEGQDALAGYLAGAFDIDVSAIQLRLPPLTLQLAVAGWVSLADWIASSELFPGLDSDSLTVATARRRAETAWAALGLDRSVIFPAPETSFADRFGFAPRPLQELVGRRAEALTAPGLLLIEAPMGEGKTEASLAAVETLARSLGCNGFVYAMPTQGTSDAMYTRVDTWGRAIDADLAVTLLHGKAMANETWRARRESVAMGEVHDQDADDYGLTDPFSSTARTAVGSGASAEWMLGRHRGLINPFVVGTVDQPLLAATHIKYVSLRYAGLAGKVVVIDEVHSYDVFMSRYLQQFLGWCGAGGIPVILMSATLPPAQRQALMSAYAGGPGPGELGAAELDVPAAPGYPSVTSWSAADGVITRSTASGLVDRLVTVEWAATDDPDNTEQLAHRVIAEAADGGCLLVVVNTVRRAQEVYRFVRDAGVPATLLHGRLTTGARADRTAQLVDLLGSGPAARPASSVVIATQIAEQSFDIDADLLITDIAPMDLLLQRIGRLHRHAANNNNSRPEHLRDPRVIVTGAGESAVEPPTFPRPFGYVYDEYSLFRTAQLIGAGSSWQIPSQVPELVATAYDEARGWPSGWEKVGAAAHAEATEKVESARARAEAGVLKPPSGAFADGTLGRLHSTGVESKVERITVRDGEPSREVTLVRWDDQRQMYRTLGGRPLGSTGERAADLSLAREVLRDTVRVRHTETLADGREGVPPPLPGWSGVPLLRSLPALVLDDAGTASGSWGKASYDPELGLVIERRYAQ